MKKWMIVVLTLLTFSFASLNAACSGADANAKVKNNIENWFAAMKSKQWDQAAKFLAPQFVSLHTDGIPRNKAQEMALIRKLNMQSYQLSNFTFTQSGDLIVATFKDNGQETIDDKPIGAGAAGRLAVLQRQKDKWLIIAYANMDTIG